MVPLAGRAGPVPVLGWPWALAGAESAATASAPAAIDVSVRARRLEVMSIEVVGNASGERRVSRRVGMARDAPRVRRWRLMVGRSDKGTVRARHTLECRVRALSYRSRPSTPAVRGRFVR